MQAMVAAREPGCHLELNAELDKRDINDGQAQAAREAWIKVAISTDARSINAMKCMRFSVDQAKLLKQ